MTCHEYSHGRIAHILGDDTAKKLGRLSFNPLKHLDILGLLVFCFVGFGWAKPVPVDPRNLDNPQRDMMWVGLAGPTTNFILAICGPTPPIKIGQCRDYSRFFVFKSIFIEWTNNAIWVEIFLYPRIVDIKYIELCFERWG